MPDELDLSRLLAPRSLAVVGDARLGARVLEKTERLGFVGPLWAVHPSGRVGRHEAVTSVSALPEGPDAAFVAVPASAVPDVVGALAARGCGGAVVYSSGFAETGPAGRALQSEVLEAAGAMPILGPNCYGLLNYVDGMAIWPDEHGGTLLPSAEQQHEQRGVALVSQSSSIAISLTMQDIGLPLAHVLTVGNAAALGPWQLARALTRRPEVSAIGLVVESLHDLRGIEALARASRETATPVVALVLGRSVQAQRVVLSHSASMASDAAVGADLLNRCGIGRVECVDSLLGTLSLLHCGGPLSGGALTSLSSSGGEAALVADSCVETGVGFADLSPGQRDALGRALGPRVTLDNPLDYHTYVWGDLAAMRETFVAMTQGPGDLHLLFADIPRDDRCDPGDWLLATQAFAQALTQTGARGALVAAMAANLRGQRAVQWVRDGLPVLAPVRVAVDAAQVAAAIGQAWSRPPAEAVHGRGDDASYGDGGSHGGPLGRTHHLLDEPRAKRLLAGHGARIPAGGVAQNAQEAVEVAEVILRAPHAALDASRVDLPNQENAPAPIALVVKGVGAAHKTDLDGVRLGLSTSDEVAAAARELLRRFDAVLVEQLVVDVVAELLVSVDLDPTFGPVLTLGWGGTRTELLADTCRLVLPSPRARVREALLGLRCAPLLTGYRGSPAGDLDALLDAVEAIVATATSVPPRTVEVNPLLVTSTGAWVADALVIEVGAHPSPGGATEPAAQQAVDGTDHKPSPRPPTAGGHDDD